jgi:hypothetical protein
MTACAACAGKTGKYRLARTRARDGEYGPQGQKRHTCHSLAQLALIDGFG